MWLPSRRDWRCTAFILRRRSLRLENPDAGLLASQEKTLTALASDFLIYLQSKPDARLTLEGHADPRGSVEYNQALSQRRVDRVKGFLVALGVPAANIQTKAFGEQENLTDRQVKDAVERNPELSPEDRQKVLKNMRMIILASNRRVDITLSNVGQASQQSVREYPFNAADSLTLLKEEETKRPPGRGLGKRQNRRLNNKREVKGREASRIRHLAGLFIFFADLTVLRWVGDTRRSLGVS